MDRTTMLERLDAEEGPWDVVVIGGGASGLGTAVEAASRGYRTALLEASDFAKGTSSRSTKLIHGGVRYLQQGNISLVLEALEERGRLRQNAPHLVHDLPFIVPNYDWWEAPFYGIGLRLYDMLAGRLGFGRSRNLSVEETLSRLPTIETDGLRGGVIYHDGQFDDARLAIHLAATAASLGAVLVNYTRVVGFEKRDDVVCGVIARDEESGRELHLKGKVVINATGAFTDAVRRLDQPDAAAMIQPSQGVHIVLDKSFLPGDSAIMVPHTDDGRVLFAIPWQERVVVGTTDTPIEEASLEPRALPEEVEFLLEHTARYLTKDPTAEDIKSVFAGVRPLVGTAPTEEGDTAAISREHTIHISRSGLVTLAGGKWTTYRKMAEDTINQAALLGGLEEKPCVSKNLKLHGFDEDAARFGALEHYGSDAPGVNDLIAEEERLKEPIHPAFSVRTGEVIWAVRHEMARTVEDFLSRRTRCLLLDARASIEASPRVAALMAEALGKHESWATQQKQSYSKLAEGYLAAS